MIYGVVCIARKEGQSYTITTGWQLTEAGIRNCLRRNSVFQRICGGQWYQANMAYSKRPYFLRIPDSFSARYAGGKRKNLCRLLYYPLTDLEKEAREQLKISKETMALIAFLETLQRAPPIGFSASLRQKIYKQKEAKK